MRIIITIILLVTSMVFAAGEKEFGKLLNDLSVSLDNLSIKIESAKNGNDIAKALKLFVKSTKPISLQKKILEKKYPLFFREDTELPEALIPQAEKLAKSSERYNEAMTVKVDFMDEEVVQNALDESENVFMEFGSLLGSEEDDDVEDE